MSADPIRAALEAALAAMTPAISTAWENVGFTPVSGVPYQRVNLLRAQPDNREIGPVFVEQGFLQVTLCYPTANGPTAAEARALQLRRTFKRTSTFVVGGVTVIVHLTPQIVPAQIDGDRYALPVRIPFRACVLDIDLSGGILDFSDPADSGLIGH